MLEKYLIAHCAPTLAGIKTGNLFRYRYHSEDELKMEIEETNKKLINKGICLEILKTGYSDALILAYRPVRLSADFSKPGAEKFLKGVGYTGTDTQYAILKLKEQFSKRSDFPHEIGLFLGYPLEDVIGFIENGGQNSRCAGCWKVYCDEQEAEKRFRRYQKCRDVYCRMFAQGCSISKLAVAV